MSGFKRLAGMALTLLAARTATASTPAVLRPLDLLADARYVGRTVEVEIVEPISGPVTAEQLARLEYGQLEVRIPEGSAGTLALVPATWTPTDPQRFHAKFDRVLIPPLRARGTLLRDPEMSDTQRPYYVLRVASVEPLKLPEPEALPELARVAADPAHWDRRPVIYEGTLRSGFEISTLDGAIWLELAPDAAIPDRPRAAAGERRVRATGVLFAHPGARYGHLGSCAYLLLATHLEELPPK